MLKVAYLVHLNFDESSGVFKKIISQVKIWQSFGHEVKLFIVTRNPMVIQAVRKVDLKVETAFYQLRNIKSRILAFTKVVKAIEIFRPNVVYLRRDLVYPPVYRLATLLPMVIEINSEELSELYNHSKLQWIYHFVARRLIDRHVKGMVFVTQELARYGYYGKLNLPKAVIGNGIDLEALPRLSVSKAKTPHLFFIVGMPALWHGIDKVMFLAREFPSWTFHIVGLTANDCPGAPRNVHFYGRLLLEEYLPIAAQAHVGIGTLALHRNGLNEASPLKVREYLALGLPVIIGYKDTDFSGQEPWICQIPNCEDNVQKSLGKIEEFVTRWMGQRVNREAVAHLDYRVKEAKRLAFLESITGGGRSEC